MPENTERFPFEEKTEKAQLEQAKLEIAAKVDKIQKLQSEAPIIQEKKRSTDLQTTDTGIIALRSLSEQTSFAAKLIELEMVSSSFKTPSQVVIGFQYAKALNLNEIVALRLMYVVNGRPCLYAEGPLLLCQRSELVEDISEFYIDENGEHISFANKNLKSKVWGAVTHVARKGQKTVQEDTFTLDDLERSGIDSSKYGKKDIWKKFERNMLRYKARSMALKTKFADLIGGIPISEQDYHFSPETPEITVSEPKKDLADQLNKDFLTDVDGV